MPSNNSKKDKAKKRSLVGYITIGLVSVVVIVSIIVISLGYYDAIRDARAQLEDQADDRITSMTAVLELPLWNLDKTTIESIGSTYIQGALVTRVKITDSWGTVLFSAEEETDAPLIIRASEIWHEGQLVGYVEISLTSAPYRDISQRLLWSTILVVSINLVCLISVIVLFLHRFLRRPLQQLSQIVNSYAAGNYESPVQQMTFVEFQPLVVTLGEMGDKIKSQVKQLRQSEEKARQEANQWHTTFEATNDAICTLDAEQRIDRKSTRLNSSH